MIRGKPERLGEVVTANNLENYFLYFKVYLDDIGFSQANAASAFLQDYFGAWVPWSDTWIPQVMQRVALENARKYTMMCEAFTAEYDPLENYNRTEETTEERTPDLTTERSSETSGTDTTTRTKNLVEHRKDIATPPTGGDAWSETSETSVSPYDSGGDFYGSEKTVRTENGYRDIQTSYEGDPDSDETERSSESSETTTETGTDTKTITSNIHGNIGVLSSQDMLEQQLRLAAKMNVFREIEKDIAAKLFLQVW